MAFDINLKDVSGQNALYIACQMGNPRLVESLLKYRVPCRKIGEPKKEANLQSPIKEEPSEKEQPKSASPTKRRVSDGIAGIISRLSVLTHQNLSSSNSSKVRSSFY